MLFSTYFQPSNSTSVGDLRGDSLCRLRFFTPAKCVVSVHRAVHPFAFASWLIECETKSVKR